jgi:hypothetical protein
MFTTAAYTRGHFIFSVLHKHQLNMKRQILAHKRSCERMVHVLGRPLQEVRGRNILTCDLSDRIALPHKVMAKLQDMPWALSLVALCS